MKNYLSTEQQEFIKANRFRRSGKAMAKELGFSKSFINCWMRKSGLAVPKEMVAKFRRRPGVIITTSTPQIDEIIRREYLTTPIKTLSRKIGKSSTFVKTRLRQLKLIIPKEVIDQRKKDSLLKPGCVPPNKGKKIREYMSEDAVKKVLKTTFKKGSKPHNTLERDGIVKVRTNKSKTPYKFIRLSENQWYPYHQHLWIQKYGPYNGRKFCLWFKDGDQMNCAIENLELISRKENARRNRDRFKSLPEPTKRIIRLNNKLKTLIDDSNRKKATAVS